MVVCVCARALLHVLLCQLAGYEDDMLRELQGQKQLSDSDGELSVGTDSYGSNFTFTVEILFTLM